MDEPEMAPMRPGHQLEDDGRLAMPAGAEHQGFVGPLHGERSTAPGGRGRASGTRARRRAIETAPAAKHDLEKWLPVFGKDHAQTKR